MKGWAHKISVQQERGSRLHKIYRRLPNEEGLEALASRLRPITLQGDPTWFGFTLTALGALSGRDVDLVERARDLRQAWTKAMGETLRGYSVQVIAPTLTEIATDRKLGRAWLYGDLIHADVHDPDIENLGLDERVMAAVSLMDEILLLTSLTLALVEEAQADGRIRLPVECFERPVVVGKSMIEGSGSLILAPVGTEPPSSLEPLTRDQPPEGWTFFDPPASPPD